MKKLIEDLERLEEGILSKYDDRELLDMMRIFYPDEKNEAALKAKVKEMKTAPEKDQKQFVKFVESVKRVGGLFVKAIKKEKKSGRDKRSFFH